MNKEKVKKQELKLSLKQSLVKSLKQAVEELGYEPKKFKTEIVKASQQLAKVIAKNKKSVKLKEPEPVMLNDPNQLGTTDSEMEDEVTADLKQEPQPGKRVVKESNRNTNTDPVTLARELAHEKELAGEPDLHQQLGSVS